MNREQILSSLSFGGGGGSTSSAEISGVALLWPRHKKDPPPPSGKYPGPLQFQPGKCRCWHSPRSN